jgi:hypothetical protein
MTPRTPPSRVVPRLLAVLAAAALAGCGGGVWFGIDGGFDDDDDAPTVALAASAPAARPGEVVQLVAAASDDFGVDHVAFYRLEAAGGTTLLGRDTAAPYTLDVLVQAGTAGASYFAQAVDDVGQASDSAVVSVTTLP